MSSSDPSTWRIHWSAAAWRRIGVIDTRTHQRIVNQLDHLARELPGEAQEAGQTRTRNLCIDDLDVQLEIRWPERTLFISRINPRQE